MQTSSNLIATPITPNAVAVKNMSYVIDGTTFTLVDGKASVDTAPGSASKDIVTLFGEPVYGDINDDGIKDAALLLVRNGGGSGEFYYAVMAIASRGLQNNYVATNALFLGDRIAPQTVEIHNGQALYNYAERKEGEAMTVQPSIGKSLYIYYDMKAGTIREGNKK